MAPVKPRLLALDQTDSTTEFDTTISDSDSPTSTSSTPSVSTSTTIMNTRAATSSETTSTIATSLSSISAQFSSSSTTTTTTVTSTNPDPSSPSTTTEIATTSAAELSEATTLDPQDVDIRLIIGLAIGSLFCLLIVACVILMWWYCKRRRVKKYGGYGPLRRTLDDTPDTMDFAQLVRTTARIISSDAQAEEFVERIPDKEAEKDADGKSNAYVAIEHCRIRGLRLKKATRVILRGVRHGGDRLHMNRLHDFYGNTILLCQAPLSAQFADQWKAIWQEKVGVVVWIGPFKEASEQKMEPYIALQEHGRIRCGSFKPETTMVVKKTTEYDSYLVQAQLRGHTRLITFLHVHMWPDSGVPLSPAKLADFVERLQEQMDLKAREHNLPNLLVHCSAGIQRSPTLIGVLIARQIFLSVNRVNVLGIFQYIRRCRYKVLGVGNPAAQIQVAFGILQIFAMRREMGRVGALMVEEHEKRVFNQQQRYEELESSDKTLYETTDLRMSVGEGKESEKERNRSRKMRGGSGREESLHSSASARKKREATRDLAPELKLVEERPKRMNKSKDEKSAAAAPPMKATTLDTANIIRPDEKPPPSLPPKLEPKKLAISDDKPKIQQGAAKGEKPKPEPIAKGDKPRITPVVGVKDAKPKPAVAVAAVAIKDEKPIALMPAVPTAAEALKKRVPFVEEELSYPSPKGPEDPKKKKSKSKSLEVSLTAGVDTTKM